MVVAKKWKALEMHPTEAKAVHYLGPVHKAQTEETGRQATSYVQVVIQLVQLAYKCKLEFKTVLLVKPLPNSAHHLL